MRRRRPSAVVPIAATKLLHLSLTEGDGSGAPTLCQNSRTVSLVGYLPTSCYPFAQQCFRNNARPAGRIPGFRPVSPATRDSLSPPGIGRIASGLQFFDEF